jgi:hypothetical protein
MPVLVARGHPKPPHRRVIARNGIDAFGGVVLLEVVNVGAGEQFVMCRIEIAPGLAVEEASDPAPVGGQTRPVAGSRSHPARLPAAGSSSSSCLPGEQPRPRIIDLHVTGCPLRPRAVPVRSSVSSPTSGAACCSPAEPGRSAVPGVEQGGDQGLRYELAVALRRPSPATAPAQPKSPACPWAPPAVPLALLAQARTLNAGHRAATGRPISRDALRARLRIGRDRASALIAAVRAEPAVTGG